MTSLFDIFKDVACLTSQFCGFDVAIYLGNPLEINNVRQKEDKVCETKFPAIFMFFDIDEDHTLQNGNYSITPNFAIVNETDKSYIAEQREEYNFKPVLTPIYENFIKAIQKSKYFDNPHYISHTKKNHYFYGSSESDGASEFDSIMDAITLTINDLRILKTC